MCCQRLIYHEASNFKKDSTCNMLIQTNKRKKEKKNSNPENLHGGKQINVRTSRCKSGEENRAQCST